MKIPIVITSINPPTIAIKKFCQLKNTSLIVVGDNKTPSNWKNNNTSFLSIQDQHNKYPLLSKIVSQNHYARKIFGYLEAIKSNPEFIYETDDDNIPTANFPNFRFTKFNLDELSSDLPTINIYSMFTKKNIWPRGLPLSSINKPHSITKKKVKVYPYIQQGLCNLDPDVDAIYRLTIGELITFDENKQYSIGKHTYSPFNSQNTLFHKKFFSLMYLPSTVSPRATDIWRSYIAQRILWEFDSNLIFLSPSVYQERNIHNLMTDFSQELEVYQKVDEIIKILNDLPTLKGSVEEMLLRVYKELVNRQLFDNEELEIVKVWLKELKNITQSTRA